MNARRVHHCRQCRRDTAQRFLFTQNGACPPAHHFRCETCGLVLLTLGDVPDADGLCLAVLNEWRRKRNGNRRGEQGWRVESSYDGARTFGLSDGDARLDLDDLLLYLHEQVWRAWLRYDGRGTFRGYATEFLRNRVKDWLRSETGRNLPKSHASAVSLDTPADEDDEGADNDSVGSAHAGVVAHGEGHSLLDFRRALARADSDTPGDHGRGGRSPDEEAAA